jgi:hypothetical protein
MSAKYLIEDNHDNNDEMKLDKQHRRSHILKMPARSPDLAPVERVWHKMNGTCLLFRYFNQFSYLMGYLHDTKDILADFNFLSVCLFAINSTTNESIFFKQTLPKS